MSESEDTLAVSNPEGLEDDDETDTDYDLNDLPDGSGCAEIWDFLSDRRRQD